jgi:hypothetical protein
VLLSTPPLSVASSRRTHHGGVHQVVGGIYQRWFCCLCADSWWTVGPDQEVWGKPEDIYVKLKQGYDAAGIPVKSWEPDNNWIVTYKGGE